MTQPKPLILFVLILFYITFSFGQKRNEKQDISTTKNSLQYIDFNYTPYIKSIQLSHIDSENSFPIIDINKSESLIISFDDLRADHRSFYYSVVYCNADWTASRLAPLDYLTGFNEDRIYTIQPAQNTSQSYTHYAFSFPNDLMQPKLAGNYLLKVYEDADEERLLFSRKIYVLKNEVNLDTEIIPSVIVSKKSKNQKLNIIVHSHQEIISPNVNLQVHVFQNQRPDNFKIVKTPAQITKHQITYNHPDSLDFEGNNEFRTLDLRSTRSTSSTIRNIMRDSAIHAELNTDEKISNSKYLFKPDENGRFFIRNIDFDDANTQSEYIYTLFSLKDTPNVKGDIYLVGAFNNYKLAIENKLTYNTQTEAWVTTQLLKQGVYDYEYLLMAQNEILTANYSGSFFETENEYQILVYYRKPGTYWDEIIGFKNITTIKQ